MKKRTRKQSLLQRLFDSKPETTADKDKTAEPRLQPALQQIGITDCPVCKHEVAVFLTKTHRPFVNCGFCSARIFYNGRESMRRLKRKMTEIDE